MLRKSFWPEGIFRSGESLQIFINLDGWQLTKQDEKHRAKMETTKKRSGTSQKLHTGQRAYLIRLCTKAAGVLKILSLSD